MDVIAKTMVAKIPSIRLGDEAGEKKDVVLNIEQELDKWAMECEYKGHTPLNGFPKL